MNESPYNPSGESYPEFLDHFKSSLKNLFQKENIDQLCLSRGLPPSVWKEIMNLKPLSVAVPSEFGGRGLKVKECLGILSAASYESASSISYIWDQYCAFSGACGKIWNEAIKENIFNHFLKYGAMGGLMITEPDFGSDALNMKTQNELKGNSYEIKGTKHWQGLTGLANYWLITSRNINADGNLSEM